MGNHRMLSTKFDSLNEWVFNRYYDKNGLAYHNRDHVTLMLRNASIYENRIENEHFKEDLHLAILYHDTYYDPSKCSDGYNEKRSISNLIFDYEMGFIPAFHNQIDRVSNMILTTSFHFQNKNYDSYVTNLLLDLDLFTFKGTYEIFKKTNENIDKEFYKVYSKEETDKKRFDFLFKLGMERLVKFRVTDSGGNIPYTNIYKYLRERYHEYYSADINLK